MFDKLIESDTAGAEFKNRSRYFTVSTIIVGILFLTAVVYSLYAADIGLGAINLDVSELVAPLEATEPEAEPDRPRDKAASTDDADQPTRQVIMASTNVPTIAPTQTSSERNPFRSTDPRRYGDIKIGITDVDGPASRLPGGTGGSSATSGSRSIGDDGDEEIAKTNPPPPVRKPAILRKSKVMNGYAISLPKPMYPQTAVVMNLQGTVRVQVTIDETGRVISAKAADGHPFFRLASEQAARNARFKPTLLNDVPVKVTGLIVYNFKRN